MGADAARHLPAQALLRRRHAHGDGRGGCLGNDQAEVARDHRQRRQGQHPFRRGPRQEARRIRLPDCAADDHEVPQNAEHRVVKATEAVDGVSASHPPATPRDSYCVQYGVPRHRGRRWRLLFYFAFTLFVSATLLFFVQPLVGKMILPRLGGTPAVWNTCMVFFQGVLLVGYAYTHTLSTSQSHRRQLLIQLAILLLPFLVLPFSLGNWSPPTESNPILSVLWLLLGLVGSPCFVVSTSAPLLQRWFGVTGHPAAKDPYFLYGASNLGSMLGLLAYPILIEPLFDVPTQAWLWTAGYAFFALLVAGCV